MANGAQLTHLDSDGAARMVDVSEKAVTRREAVASACVLMKEETLRAILSGSVVKGDVAASARIAGIMAAKRVSELIPLCHPIGLESVAVELLPDGPGRLRVRARVVVQARTGAEMEAMSASAVAALTVYDMAKSIDRAMTVTDLRVEQKHGGKRGEYRRNESRYRLSADRLDVNDMIDCVSGAEFQTVGAVATFIGTVRGDSLENGDRVIALEYEAYPAMVLGQMVKIGERIERDIQGARIAMAHRTGRLSVGEMAVVIAASAPHREEAFRACRAAIEAIKRDAPIWKKEVTASGESWLGCDCGEASPQVEHNNAAL